MLGQQQLIIMTNASGDNYTLYMYSGTTFFKDIHNYKENLYYY